MTRAQKVLKAIRVGEYCAWTIPYAISEGATSADASRLANAYYLSELMRIERM